MRHVTVDVELRNRTVSVSGPVSGACATLPARVGGAF